MDLEKAKRTLSRELDILFVKKFYLVKIEALWIVPFLHLPKKNRWPIIFAFGQLNFLSEIFQA